MPLTYQITADGLLTITNFWTKETIVTASIGHFSARYEDESILLNEASAIFPQTILAKENMCIDVDGGTVYEK